MPIRTLKIFFLSLAALIATGCASLDTVDPPIPVDPVPTPGYSFAKLDLSGGVVPLPNDLLRNPQTGRVQFPGTGEPFDAINSLDGFSTTGPIIIPFGGLLQESTVNNDNIRLYDLETGEQKSLTFTYVETDGDSTVIAAPVFALNPESTHLVVVTNGVISALNNEPLISDQPTTFIKQLVPLVDANGNSTTMLLENEQARSLEEVRLGYQPIWTAAEGLTGVDRQEIPLAFAFTTQTLFADLPAARAVVVNANRGLVTENPRTELPLPVAQGHGGPVLPGLPTVPEFFDTFVPAPFNTAPNASIGSIWMGSVEAPIFRDDSYDGYWTSPPVQMGTQKVPYILCLPDGPGPFPTAIFQHGITLNKGAALVLANAANSQGVALIAIDLELHGDLKAEGLTDGDGFINLVNLRNSRDNIRQSVVNLYALTQAIVSGQSALDGGTTPMLAPVPPLFTGMSLGSMVGTAYTATEPNVTRAVLNVPGARIFPLLTDSPTFGPVVLDGLAAAGIQPGSAQFLQFGLIAQTVVDDADPVNYAKYVLDGDLRGGEGLEILQQMALNDEVVPPSAQYDLANQFSQASVSSGFSQVDAKQPLPSLPQVASPYDGSGLYEIFAGHGGLLNPADGPTVQIVTQMLAFLGLGNIIDPGFPLEQSVLGRSLTTEEIEAYQRAVSF